MFLSIELSSHLEKPLFKNFHNSKYRFVFTYLIPRKVTVYFDETLDRNVLNDTSNAEKALFKEFRRQTVHCGQLETNLNRLSHIEMNLESKSVCRQFSNSCRASSFPPLVCCYQSLEW